jgi:hypothetical protein
VAPNNTPPNPAERRAAAAGAETEKESVTVAELPAALAKVKSADEVRAMKASDDRATAQAVYDARIEELEAPEAEKHAPKSGGHARKARTRVKYQGKRYEPGDTVPFASARDAEPYDAARALVPVQQK